MLREYQSDYCSTFSAADQLAAKIRRVWAARGVTVKVWVKREAAPDTAQPFWVIRSDIRLSGRAV